MVPPPPASAATPPSKYAKAPNWAFQHYSHFDAKDAHKAQPRLAASETALATAAWRARSRAGQLPEDEPLPFGTFGGLPPVYMVHLAALRSGAWQRRAVLRAHGWWHARADVLAAQQLGWGRRRGLLLLSSANIMRTSGHAPTSVAEANMLIGNLLALAALLGRVAVIPEVPCEELSAPPSQWKETRRRQGQRRCAWVPPRSCWKVEYMTALELQRAVSANATLATEMRGVRNRTSELRLRTQLKALEHANMSGGLRLSAGAAGAVPSVGLTKGEALAAAKGLVTKGSLVASGGGVKGRAAKGGNAKGAAQLCQGAKALGTALTLASRAGGGAGSRADGAEG